MVEDMFNQSLRAAYRAARRLGLSELNAHMIALDAAEDAWAELRGDERWTDMPRFAVVKAKSLARAERRQFRAFQLLLDGYPDEPEVGGVIVGIPAKQDNHIDLSMRLGDLISASESLDETDRRILRSLMCGMSVLDIAKQIGRAVPLLVSDVSRIRETLKKSVPTSTESS